MSYSEKKLDTIFSKGRVIRNRPSHLYRRDIYGNSIYRPSYGKETGIGWEVDHIKPRAKGGSDALRNLQPLHWTANREKGAKRR